MREIVVYVRNREVRGHTVVLHRVEGSVRWWFVRVTWKCGATLTSYTRWKEA